MPRGIRGNANTNTNANPNVNNQDQDQDQEAAELTRIISSINAEVTPEYSADTEARFARAGVLDAPEGLEPPMLLLVLFASAGLRECMGLLVVLPRHGVHGSSGPCTAKGCLQACAGRRAVGLLHGLL